MKTRKAIEGACWGIRVLVAGALMVFCSCGGSDDGDSPGPDDNGGTNAVPVNMSGWTGTTDFTLEYNHSARSVGERHDYTFLTTGPEMFSVDAAGAVQDGPGSVRTTASGSMNMGTWIGHIEGSAGLQAVLGGQVYRRSDGRFEVRITLNEEWYINSTLRAVSPGASIPIASPTVPPPQEVVLPLQDGATEEWTQHYPGPGAVIDLTYRWTLRFR